MQLNLPSIHLHIAELHIHTFPQSLGATLSQILQGITKMAGEIDALKVAVTTENGVIESAIVLINGIGQRVTDAVNAALAANPGVDLSPITDVVNSMNSEASALASAVAANTPVSTPAP